MTDLRQAAQAVVSAWKAGELGLGIKEFSALEAALAAQQAAQPVVQGFNPAADCSPTLTQCPRCNNPNGVPCDGGRAAQQAEPSQTIYCAEKRKPGGCQLHNLHCGWPKCNESSQQAAQPVAPNIRAALQQASLALEELDGPGYLIGGVMHHRISLLLPMLNEAIDSLADAAAQPQDELQQAKARIDRLETEMRKLRGNLLGVFDRELWDSLG